MATEKQRRTTLLPLGRIGAGRDSVEANFDVQLERASSERQTSESSSSGAASAVRRDVASALPGPMR